MSGFNDRFGGSTIQPADVRFREVIIQEDLQFEWPPYATTENVIARSNSVIPTAAGLTVFMPDARDVSIGESIMFYNESANAYVVADSLGAAIASIPAGAKRLIELTDNTTQGGSWLTTVLGVGTGTLDIAAAAGAGLRAVGTQLQVALPVVAVDSSRVIAEPDRMRVLVWTGGTGTLTLPNTGDLPLFGMSVRNQGTGALTLQPTGGQLIDGVSNIVLNVNESLELYSSSLNFWVTIGRGRNAQFNFTQLQKTVTGGTVVLTLTEAANVVQTYTGALTSNVDIVLPSIVQVYYISNQTTGAFNFRVRNVATGATVSIPSGQNAILFSDGVNVINASTTLAGIGQLTFAAGSVTNPSVAIGEVTTGFYSPTSGSIAFASGGIAPVVMDGNGLLVQRPSAPVMGVKATTGPAAITVSRPAGAAGGTTFLTVNTPRAFIGVNADAESGANAGSNFVLYLYDDAGVLLSTPITINRATGQVIINQGRDRSKVGEIVQFIGGAIAHPGVLPLDGTLVSRATYADLWNYANASGSVVTEDQWNNQSYWGRFSVGDGSTTFRLPDLRGVHTRGFDNGRGLDPGREWGRFQDMAVLSHGHGISDPSHVHGVGDPGHAHSVADPGHAHSAYTDVQGNHQHTYTRTDPSGQFAQNAFNWSVFNSQVGAATSADGNHGHNVGVNGAGTGIGIYGAGTGIYLGYSGTGITVSAAGGAQNLVRNMAYTHYIRY